MVHFSMILTQCYEIHKFILLVFNIKINTQSSEKVITKYFITKLDPTLFLTVSILTIYVHGSMIPYILLLLLLLLLHPELGSIVEIIR